MAFFIIKTPKKTSKIQLRINIMKNSLSLKLILSETTANKTIGANLSLKINLIINVNPRIYNKGSTNLCILFIVNTYLYDSVTTMRGMQPKDSIFKQGHYTNGRANKSDYWLP